MTSEKGPSEAAQVYALAALKANNEEYCPHDNSSAYIRPHGCATCLATLFDAHTAALHEHHESRHSKQADQIAQHVAENARLRAALEQIVREIPHGEAAHKATKYPTHCDKCLERMPCDWRVIADTARAAIDGKE